MKRKKMFFGVWIIVNLILVIKYFVDFYGIRCEPCPPDLYCPPCQTDFMKNILWYLGTWNVLMILFRAFYRKLPGK